MAGLSQRFRSIVPAFQRTLTSQISLKSPLPFGINMTVFYVHFSDNVSSRNSACTMSTIFYQLVESSESSHVAAISHWRRCSALITEGPPERFRQSLITSQAFSPKYYHRILKFINTSTQEEADIYIASVSHPPFFIMLDIENIFEK